jgi:hypothetical protein
MTLAVFADVTPAVWWHAPRCAWRDSRGGYPYTNGQTCVHLTVESPASTRSLIHRESLYYASGVSETRAPDCIFPLHRRLSAVTSYS